MNKRKLLTLAMTLCMVAILAIGGTLAYFTDNDSKTNVFTVGNVGIHIDEWMEDANGNDIPYVNQELHPIDMDKITLNKKVETVNDGTEDAYIRTYVTCPYDMYWMLGLGFNSGANSGVTTNAAGKNMYNVTWKDIGHTEINGEETSVFVCEYKGKVAAGESVLSLTSVWLYDSVTNEDINKVGNTFNVEVYSEAIQAQNLTYDEAMAELQGNDATLLEHAASLFNSTND